LQNVAHFVVLSGFCLETEVSKQFYIRKAVVKMVRRFFLCLFGFFILFFGHSQNIVNPLLQIDNAVKTLAGDLHKKIIEAGAGKITVGQFTHRDSIPSLGAYWASQLVEELANIPNRPFTILAGGTSGADWIISGEIIETALTIRVYTRLVRSSDRAIAGAVHSDFERGEYFSNMLSSGEGSPVVAWDEWEPDSWNKPTAAEIGNGPNAEAANRTLHWSDEDFFLLVPNKDGVLTMETTGGTDTHMELYEAGSQNMLAENDDGGSGGNARIRENLRAGTRYIAKIRGYSRSDTGAYGFRAYFVDSAVLEPDEYENDNTIENAKELIPGIPQRHSFTSGDDLDWLTFRISRTGRYTIYARGGQLKRT
jgi:hypothetical protein